MYPGDVGRFGGIGGFFGGAGGGFRHQGLLGRPPLGNWGMVEPGWDQLIRDILYYFVK